MKRFFYSHPLMTQVLLVVFWLLPSTGLVAPLVLEMFGIELTNLLMLLCMLGGPLLSLLLALPFLCIPTLKCLDETLDELWQLKRARKAFHAPQNYLLIEDAKANIEQNLKKRKLTEIDHNFYYTESVTCAGIWMKDVTFHYRYGDEIHPIYYLLYTTNQLDFTDWELLQKKINRQLLDLETESLRRLCSKPAYAIGILCNGAEATVLKQVQKIQSYQTTDAHVCVGIVPKNIWHLPAYRISENEPSKLARTLLGKGTFGLKCSTFPYKNNDEYTDEFYQRVEHLCNSRLADNVTDEQRKNAKNGIRDVIRSLGKSSSAKNIEKWKSDFESTKQDRDGKDE